MAWIGVFMPHIRAQIRSRAFSSISTEVSLSVSAANACIRALLNQNHKKGEADMKRISVKTLLGILAISLALPVAADDVIGTWRDTETGGVCIKVVKPS
jgi:hypothetical protein